MVYIPMASGRSQKLTIGRGRVSSLQVPSRRDGSRYLFRGRLYKRLYKLPQYTGENEECLCCTLEDGCCSAVASLLCVIYLLILIASVQKSPNLKKTMQEKQNSDTDFGTPVYVLRSGNPPFHSYRQESALQDPNHCQPKENFVFIRHNQSANHILTNILQRFGDMRDLNFAIPECIHSKGKCQSQHRWENRTRYNIICDSSRFTKMLIEFMPSDSIYFTMIRDPSKKPANLNCLHPVVTGNQGKTCCENTHIINEMIYNLGYDDTGSITSAKSALLRLESFLGFVLIDEYFEESLLLLKKEMCWSFNDIMYYIPRIKFNEHYRYFSQHCSECNTCGVQNQTLDIMLYDYFNRTFWRRLRHYGKDFHNDLHTLRLYIQLLSDSCDAQFLRQDGGGIPKNETVVITKPSLEYCQKVVKSNSEYSKYLSNEKIT